MFFLILVIAAFMLISHLAGTFLVIAGQVSVEKEIEKRNKTI